MVWALAYAGSRHKQSLPRSYLTSAVTSRSGRCATTSCTVCWHSIRTTRLWFTMADYTAAQSTSTACGKLSLPLPNRCLVVASCRCRDQAQAEAEVTVMKPAFARDSWIVTTLIAFALPHTHRRFHNLPLKIPRSGHAPKPFFSTWSCATRGD